MLLGALGPGGDEQAPSNSMKRVRAGTRGRDALERPR